MSELSARGRDSGSESSSSTSDDEGNLDTGEEPLTLASRDVVQKFTPHLTCC